MSGCDSNSRTPCGPGCRRIAQLQSGSYRNCGPVDALCCDVFGEVAESHIEPALSRLFNAFICKKTHLTVPETGMRIAFDADAGDEVDGKRRGLAEAVGGAAVDGEDDGG